MNNVSPDSNGIIVEYYSDRGEIVYSTLHTKGDLQMQFRFGRDGRTFVRVGNNVTFQRLIQLSTDAGGTAVFCVSNDPATDEELSAPTMNTYRITREDGSVEDIRGFDVAEAIRACEGGPSHADIKSVERIS